MKNWHPDLSRSASPLYMAIADLIALDLQGGQLAPGDKLPLEASSSPAMAGFMIRQSGRHTSAMTVELAFMKRHPESGATGSALLTDRHAHCTASLVRDRTSRQSDARVRPRIC